MLYDYAEEQLLIRADVVEVLVKSSVIMRNHNVVVNGEKTLRQKLDGGASETLVTAFEHALFFNFCENF